MQLDACWETNEILIKQIFLAVPFIVLDDFLVQYYVMKTADREERATLPGDIALMVLQWVDCYFYQNIFKQLGLYLQNNN